MIALNPTMSLGYNDDLMLVPQRRNDIALHADDAFNDLLPRILWGYQRNDITSFHSTFVYAPTQQEHIVTLFGDGI